MRKVRQQKKRKGAISTFFHRYINGTKGVISLLLAILMVPFLSVAGILLNAARINSAVAVFDEALCNASNSTLGTYDEFLKSRFGLLAMSQNTSANGVNYSVQQLIDDTFQEYMRKNVGALSNTYFNVETEGYGVYPLTVPGVLHFQVCEAGKYAVPTKLAIDFLSLDDMLNALTSSLNVGKNIFGAITNFSKAADNFLTMGEEQEKLKKKIGENNKLKVQKDTDYNSFSSAANAYNTLVDQRVIALAGCDNNISAAKETIKTSQSTVEEETEKQRELVNQLLALENEKDSHGNKVDNSAAIAALKESNAEALKPYLTARTALEDAKDDLSDAERDKVDTEEKYKNDIAAARTKITTTRDAYVNTLEQYAESIRGVGNGADTVQTSFNTMVSSGLSAGADILGQVNQSKKSAAKDHKKILEDQRAEAERNHDDALVASLNQKIEESEKASLKSDSNLSLYKEGAKAIANMPRDVQSFNSRQFKPEYDGYYQTVIETKERVKEYTVPTEDTKKAGGTSGYTVSVDINLTEEDVDRLSTAMGESIGSSAMYGLVKALLSFIKALASISIAYNWELTSTVDGSYYSGQGGLPSQRDRTNPSYSLESKYTKSDKEQSEHYKQLMGEYLNDGGSSDSFADFAKIVEQIPEDIETISDAWDKLTGIEFFYQVGRLLLAVVSLATGILYVMNHMDQMMAWFYQRLLIAGYIGYNLPNRVTYSTGRALTGAFYTSSLPSLGDDSGAGFWGAETEYIIAGGASEKANQVDVFGRIYLIRMLSDVLFIATNAEVGEIAAAATAATAVLGGWGGALVYFLYILAEPFVDSVLMANGSSIPIVKLTIYLTPTGLVDLVKEIVKIPFSKGERDSVQNSVNGVIENTDTAAEKISLEKNPTPETKPPEVEDGGGGLGQDVLKAFSVDYTQTLILIMGFFCTEKNMLNRLGDVIQMEATFAAGSQNKIGSYAFNLDHSYTYLRASGHFDSHEFIKLSDTGILTSTDRVVYRGY